MRKIVLLCSNVIVGLAIAVAACPALAASPTVPAKFLVRIGGFLGPSYSVELVDNVLVYGKVKAGVLVEPTKIRPSPEQWNAFRVSLDNIGAWKWQSTYYASDVRDGTAWLVDIEYADRKLSSAGSNSYPGLSGAPSRDVGYTKEFEAYLSAVETLIGNRPFR